MNERRRIFSEGVSSPVAGPHSPASSSYRFTCSVRLSRELAAATARSTSARTAGCATSPATVPSASTPWAAAQAGAASASSTSRATR